MLAAFHEHTNVPAELQEILGPNHHFEHNIIEVARDIRRSISEGILRNFSTQRDPALQTHYDSKYEEYRTKMKIEKDDVPYTWNYIYDTMKTNAVYFILKTHKIEAIESYLTFADRFQKICECSVNRMQQRHHWDNIPMPDFISLYSTVSFIQPTDDRLFYISVQKRNNAKDDKPYRGEGPLPRLMTVNQTSVWSPLIDFENAHAKKHTIYWTQVYQDFENKKVQGGAEPQARASSDPPSGDGGDDADDAADAAAAADAADARWNTLTHQITNVARDLTRDQTDITRELVDWLRTEPYNVGNLTLDTIKKIGRTANQILRNLLALPVVDRINSAVTMLNGKSRVIKEFIATILTSETPDQLPHVRRIFQLPALISSQEEGTGSSNKIQIYIDDDSGDDDSGDDDSGDGGGSGDDDGGGASKQPETSSLKINPHAPRKLVKPDPVKHDPADTISDTVPNEWSISVFWTYCLRTLNMQSDLLWVSDVNSGLNAPSLLGLRSLTGETAMERFINRCASLNEIWERSQPQVHVLTVNEVQRDIENFVNLTQAITEEFHGTTPYQVASVVAGFSGQQVSQLYYESNIVDAISAFTAHENSTVSSRTTTKRLKLSQSPFMNAIKEFEPGELLSGVVREKLLHKALFILLTTPKWQRKLHWRPSLHSHYLDVMEMIHHRLPSSPSFNALRDATQLERDSDFNDYGQHLFKPLNSLNIQSVQKGIKTQLETDQTKYDKNVTEEFANLNGGATNLKTPRVKNLNKSLSYGAPRSATKQVEGALHASTHVGTQRVATWVERKARQEQSEKRSKRSGRSGRSGRVEGAARALYEYRMDICHIIALRMRNDEMLRANFSGISRTYPRNKRMIQARLNLLLRKMTRDRV